MKIMNNNFPSIEQLTDQYLQKSSQVTSTLNNKSFSFQEILEAKTSQSGETKETDILKFSKHAAARLADRNISLTQTQMERLSDGTKKASEKGIQESLVVVDQLAFIVSIPNKTVITAMDQAETNENVFTNIDGAVFM